MCKAILRKRYALDYIVFRNLCFDQFDNNTGITSLFISTIGRTLQMEIFVK